MAFDYRRKLKDFILIFITRIMRMFSYGMLAVIFIDNLKFKGLDEEEVSYVQSGIVFGDVLISLYLTTRADRIGRINTLMLGALLKLITGIIYAESNSILLLTISGIFGVISVSGGEIGPFMPIQQSALSQLVEACSDQEDIPKNTSKVFGYYNMAGYLSQAAGAAFAGIYMELDKERPSYSQELAATNLVYVYAVLGGMKFVAYFLMNRDQIQPEDVKDKTLLTCTGIRKENLSTIVTLSALFAVDAFAGAFIVQSFLSYYYEKQYGLKFYSIGGALFLCNIVSGISGVLSSKLVDRIGAMATMIYTHLPSNIFLLFIAFTSNPNVSLILLLGRFCISQMDVPARQTYVSMVVSSGQRSAANGITNIARSVGLVFGLAMNGTFMAAEPNTLKFSMPFLIAGGLKIIYDITIGCLFLWNQRAAKRQQFVESSELVETPHPEQPSGNK